MVKPKEEYMAEGSAQRWLRDMLTMLGSRMGGRVGMIAALQTLAREVDDESLLRELRQDCLDAMKDVVCQEFNETPGDPRGCDCSV